ncbi:Uncharacterized protein OBRU01_10460 [Operophtera brumata]|uniref:Uncharacterized protein n=1 Tax=Operophtera brumata TaxID=104452 RepID=A0A0L7LCX7_OPEBR|nr:Uncharacterized protein OBRU01_10460 [Operophtera brumata]
MSRAEDPCDEQPQVSQRQRTSEPHTEDDLEVQQEETPQVQGQYLPKNCAAKYVKSRYGKKNMLIACGYTFSEYKYNFWYCTKRHHGCKAKAKTNPDRNIVSITSNHNHTPPDL